jgi:ankyrin repeat protein
MLIRSGADVNASDAWGDTSLHIAISLQSTDMIDLLLTNGAKILSNKYGRTPMHGSTFGSFPHDEVVIERHIKALQTAGADINGLDLEGMTPLLVSVQQGHIPMLTTLQRMGADLERTNSRERGRTIFHTVAMFSDPAMVRTLHEPKLSLIDPNQPDKDGLTAMEMISRCLKLSAAEFSEGQRPASADELSFFQCFVNESRAKYWQARAVGSRSDRGGNKALRVGRRG